MIGAGLIGRRRAIEAASHPDSRCVVVVDADPGRAAEVARAAGATADTDWRSLMVRGDIDAVVAATPNGLLCEIATAALAAGKHVLVEKPMGRSLAEAEQMRASALRAGKLLKVGFNHRHHPAIAEAKRRFDRGDIGSPINARCRYGHGGRPGYEREWRGSRELAGGGELTDQGVHVADLLHWFLGLPASAFAWLQTAVWPLGDLEDNGIGMFRYDSGVVASLHTSWTQWKNLFCLELFGTVGALVVEGLGGSYGVETLTVYRRNLAGGAPESEVVRYDGNDCSWRDEWKDFLAAIRGGRPLGGSADDGVAAMRMLDALYRSAATGAPVAV
ncbi:MAG: Gfo/Idh/MocA family oxidoreductase [Gemmatimonadetes bacterium]|nr:Gfo/Idh/MocA family oxidoreductase [Gemmatimonadota bacterium]